MCLTGLLKSLATEVMTSFLTSSVTVDSVLVACLGTNGKGENRKYH